MSHPRELNHIGMHTETDMSLGRIRHSNTLWLKYFFLYLEAMSDFTMGTILGKGFTQAQVHTFNRTSAK